MPSRSFIQIYPFSIDSNGVSIPSSEMRVVTLGELQSCFIQDLQDS